MANTLSSHLHSAFSPVAVSELAGNLNESTAVTQKALDGLIPTIVSGIASRAETNEGFSEIQNLLQSTPFDTDPSVQQLVDNTDHRQKAAGAGNTILKNLCGERVHQVSEEAVSYSGIGLGSAITVTGLVTSVLMGYLHKQVSTSTLTEAQLAPLLRDEAPTTRAIVPAALAGPLGWFIGTVPPVIVETVPAAAPVAAAASTGFAWLWWLLVGLALLLLLWWLFQGRNRNEVDTTTGVVPVDTMAVNDNGMMNAEADAMPDSIPKVRVAVIVPGGRQLMLVDSSFTYNLAQYLATPGSQPNQVFFFDDLRFDFDKATIRPGAEDAINELAEIMKAYPNMNIKIVGHTDSVGPSSVNQPLSEARAKSTKEALVEHGIDANRMTTRKQGETEPIATNETPEGRQRNRRIDVIVTKL